MPIVALEVPETYDSITRPITIGLIRDILERFNLSPDTEINYTGTAGTLAQRGSQLASKVSPVEFPFIDQVRVELDEHYLEEGVLTTAIKKHDTNYIFWDKPLNVFIKPIYTRTESVIQFRYRAHSKTRILKWRDTLRRKMSEGTQALLHELIYHYSIPPAFLEILREIWEKRETIAGYNENFTEWLRACFTERLTALTNLAGEQAILAIPEKQIQVLGWFGFISEPSDIDKSIEGDTWELGFDYTIHYEKVTSIVMGYPISVHNQLLDLKYVSTEELYNPYNMPRFPSYSGYLNDNFSSINYNADFVFKGITLPVYDDWNCPKSHAKVLPVITALIGVDLRDPQQVVNLLDLGEADLTQPIINFIFRHRKDVLNYGDSILYITLYKNDRILDPAMFYIDVDMNLRCNIDLDLRSVYHFRFSILTDFTILKPKAKKALKEDPVVCIQIIDALDGMRYNDLNRIDMSTGNDGNSNIKSWFWNNSPNSRPGFNSPERDWSKIRPMNNSIAWPHDNASFFTTYLGDQVRRVKLLPVKPETYLNGTYPQVPDAFPDLVWEVITEEVLLDYFYFPFRYVGELIISKNVKIVGLRPMVDGYQTILCIYKNSYIRVTVNHFFQGELHSPYNLTEAQYALEYLDPDTTRVWDNNALGLVVTSNSVFKPTTQTTLPMRITSPLHPNERRLFLSDQLKILGGKVITDSSLDLVFSYLPNEIDFSAVGYGKGLRTIMEAGIIAHRLKG